MPNLVGRVDPTPCQAGLNISTDALNQRFAAQLQALKQENSEIAEAMQRGLLKMQRMSSRKEFVSKFKAYAYKIAGGGML